MFSFQRKKKDKATAKPSVSSAPTASLSASASGEKNNEYAEYGLGSPPRGERSVPCRKAEQRIVKDGLGKHLRNKSSEKAKMLVLLYGRGFMADSHKTNRKKKVKKIIESPAATEILLRVLEADGDMDVTAAFSSLYVNNMVVLQYYFQQEGSFGFLPDMTEAEYQFHRQKSGNCFLHGPSILLPYLAQKQAVDNFSAVDISKFVRRSFPDEDLYDYVFKDSGGHSVHTLKKLLAPFHVSSFAIVGTDSGLKVQRMGYDVSKRMRDEGPGLVHDFKTHKNFNGSKHPDGATGYLRFNGPCNAVGQFVEVRGEAKAEIEIELASFLNHGTERSVPQPRNLANDGFPAPTSTSAISARETQDSSETGKDKKKGKESEESTHAMVLIGGRRDKKGKIWLFLQNWWDEMQLVEVSSEYFKAVGASLTFVEDQTILKNANNASLENCYEMNKFRVADSNNLDRAEAPRGLLCVESRDRAA